MAMSTTLRPVAASGARWRVRLAAVGGAVLASVLLWTFFEYVLGVDLRAPASGGRADSDISAGYVVAASATASLAGWGLLAVLERVAGRARTIWTAVALVVLLISLGGPLGGTDVSVANRAGLLLMHLAVAAILIPSLRKTSLPPRASRET